MGAADTARSILTAAVGMLTALTVLAIGLYRPAKWLLRRVEGHVAETVDERVTAAMQANGGHYAEVAESCRATAAHLEVVAASVSTLAGRLDAHVDTSGRHTS